MCAAWNWCGRRSPERVAAQSFQPHACQSPPKALIRGGTGFGQGGCTVDVTAFPVAEGEDACSASEALLRYLASGAPPERVTVSSDAGGCLPCFDCDGRVCGMDVGLAGALLETLKELAGKRPAARTRSTGVYPQSGTLLRLCGRGRIEVGSAADLVALEATGAIETVIIGGTTHVRAGKPVVRGLFEP